MKFILNGNELTIEEPIKVNTGSIANYDIEVEMDESWSGLSIVAKICQEKENIAYERAVIDRHVLIDIDKLERYTIGFIGYRIEDEEKVYQKSTNLKVIPYVRGAGEIETTEEQELPTPTEWEMYLQQVQDFINDANEIIDTANNLDIDANKIGNTTTVTITKQDESQKQVQILDGEDGQDYVITQEDYQAIADVVKSQIDFIDKNVNDLTYYTLTTQTGSKIDLEINSSTYQLKAKLYDKNNNLISTSSTIDLPIESMVVNASYSNGILTLTLQNGNSINVDISDIVSGLVKPEDLTDYVKNTDYATGSKAGVVKTNSANGVGTGSTGNIYATERTYAQYQNDSNNVFVGKGTLENVITGKGLVSNTDYATSSKAGVIKTSGDVGTQGNTTTGVISAATKTYEQYQSALNNLFIGKGTLENVLAAKIGDIESILEELDIGGGVQ